VLGQWPGITVPVELPFHNRFQGETTSMPSTLYQASVPVHVRQLSALAAILDKATAYCAERKIDPAALLQARLYPDMFPLLKQVQVACSHAERGAARLAGLEPPARADKEASFEDLKGRIAEAISFVKSVDPKKMDGAEDREITYPVGPRKETRSGTDYLCNFSLPNFYFHVAAAYIILRHNGLPIGKADFMGGA
jgi:hypothetical protein